MPRSEIELLRFGIAQAVALRASFHYTVTVLLSADYKPEFESLRDRLVELAQIRHVDELLKRVVTILAERPHVALARIWVVDRGDICATCHMAARCGPHFLPTPGGQRRSASLR